MANSNYEDKLIDAIEAIAQDSVAKAGYDKTIQCQIIECIDPTIGKYKVKYQDSTFIAYSASIDVSYLPGMDVYVLVPGNDMTRDKQILGTTKKLGANYAGAVVEEENLYEPVGNNCIDSNAQYAFCSYRSQTRTIYDRSNGTNELRLNLKSVEAYIRNSSSILCGGEFKTKLPTEQQFRGNFGVIFELTFLDNSSNDLINRNYVIDVNHMLGNPYKQNNWTRQYSILNFDAVNFQYVNRIILFVENFPHQSSGKPEDIWMKNLEFCGMKALSDSELNTYGLAILKPYGTYFDETDADSAVRKFQAQVRVKGKNIDNNSQSIEYYWFVENVGIITTSPNYCVYGGQGWECKNKKNQVGTDTSGNPIYEWVPSGYEFSVTKAESPAYTTKYKCVAIYNDIILSKEEVITNYDSGWNITVESDNGEQFYNDTGNPTLVCKINNQIKSDANFTYLWAEVDSANNFYSLGETTAENNEYNNVDAAYKKLLADIEAERAMPAASQATLNRYLTTLEKYDKIMRVERMYLHKVQIKEIVGFSTYKCSVYRNGVFIGSSSIVLRNSLEAEGNYSLIINNGNKTFKYDEMGISPVNTSLDIPITLTPLTFTLYNNLGEAIPQDVLQTCDVKWKVPASNTMLVIPDAYGKPTREGDYLVYGNNLTAFTYFIADKYDISKTNNNIELQVNYDNVNLSAKTDFSFVKEGEPGTNGTEFAARIVPNIPAGQTAPLYPMLVNGRPDWSIRNNQSSKWFVVQFWHNGERIYNGFGGNAEQTTEGKTIRLKWSILANKYNTLIIDDSDISVTDEQSGSFSYKSYTGNTGHPANIIKCEISYEGVKYYATLPLITTTTQGTYKVALKENTGFRYVTYSPDGRKPSYDNSNPFELIVTKTINGYTEDVSKMTTGESVSYTWKTRGRVYQFGTDENPSHWVENNVYLIEENKTADKNQKWYKPADNYNDECVNVALECTITHSGANAAHIHIPVHLLLNRYGQAAINDWDGNSVSINEDGGIILSPQMGAGQKNADNSFTGVLMGKVKEANKTNYDIGLLGYANGARSFFLNSEDGSAIFGNGQGQILIDPSQKQAYLYSNNFWINYDVSGKPTNYTEVNENHEGMLIDLSTPSIRFGSGNFSVTKEGFLTAKGGGDIAGWHIDDYKIYKEKTGMSSVDEPVEGATYRDVKIPTADAEYANDNKIIAFWAGTNKFFVSHDGYLKAEEASIGSGTNPIFIGKSTSGDYSAIWSGRKSNFNANAAGFYVGTDGIALGTLNSNGESKFQVTNQGYLTAREGTIGGWNITRNTIATNNITLNANGDIECNINGTKKWYIHNNGDASFGGGKLTISNNGDIVANGGTFNDITANRGNFNDVTVSGTINSKVGNIGGWNIGESELYSNNVHLRSGSGNTLKAIEVNNGTFYVQNNGYVYARSGTIGGWTLSSTGLTSNSKSIIIGGSDNKIIWEKGEGYFRCGDELVHPEVSGLNVGSHGILFGSQAANTSITGDSSNLFITGATQLNLGLNGTNKMLQFDSSHILLNSDTYIQGALYATSNTEDKGKTVIKFKTENALGTPWLTFKNGILVDYDTGPSL